MVTIRPFKALRYTEKAGDIAHLLCPPYDIIDEDARKFYCDMSEYNIVHLELPEGGEDRYANAASTLKRWLDDGILAEDEKPGYYIYEQIFAKGGELKSIWGLLCTVKLEPFSSGVILPHENTLFSPKEDRLNLFSATGCMTSPIYCLFEDINKSVYKYIRGICVNQTSITYMDEKNKVMSRLWCIYDDMLINAMTKFMQVPSLTIADGHHRYETAMEYHRRLVEQGADPEAIERSSYALMYLVPSHQEDISVLPTHRIIKGIAGFDQKETCRACASNFGLSLCAAMCRNSDGSMDKNALYKLLNKSLSTERRGSLPFLLYFGDGCWYECFLRHDKQDIMDTRLPELSEASRNLDVNILHSLIIEDVLGIPRAEISTSPNISFTHKMSEAVEAVDSHHADCAFLLNPPPVETIMKIAGSGERMPQKSTCFSPKPVTGMVLYRINEN